MNRGEIRDEIRRLVNDVSTTNPRWSSTVLNTRIDQSHERTSALTKCIISVANLLSTVSGTASYTLPTGFLESINVRIKNSSGSWYELVKVTENELDVSGTNWRQSTGAPSSYYILNNKIYLYPYPDYTLASAISIDMYKRPTTFSDDSSIPFDSDVTLYAFHEALCYDVAARCKFDEDQYDKAEKLEFEYQKRLREIKYQLASRVEETRMSNIYEETRGEELRHG